MHKCCQNISKAIMSVRRWNEMLSFYSKKTAFHSSVSLHFRGTNGRYGFSRISSQKKNERLTLEKLSPQCLRLRAIMSRHQRVA